MLIELITHWTSTGTGGAGGIATGTGIAFDSDTKQVVPFYATRTLSILDPRPPDANVGYGTLVWFDCAPDFTKTEYYFNGVDNTYTQVIPDSDHCGYVAPVVYPSCDLVLSVVVTGTKVTASVTGAHGNVTFSRDGGTTRQVSGVFPNLAPGAYAISAYDDGPSNCERSLPAFVLASPATQPVLGTLPAVAFSRNPLALTVTASQPGRALLVELWVEKAHGTSQYQRLVQRLRPTDDAGQAVLQLQDQLHAVLTPERPDLTQAARLYRLTSAIRRYYATLAEVQPATGLPGPVVFTALRSTVLHGGLAWAPARAGTFFNPLPTDWLSWRPAGEQLVGPAHVALVAALVPAGAQSCGLRVRVYRRGLATAFATQLLPLPGLPGPALGAATTPYLVQGQVPLAGLPANAYRVELVLEVDGVAQTSVRRYRLAAPGQRHRQYVFLNSLGQWDTLDCPGPLTSKGSVERTVATHLMAANYDPQEGPEAVVNVALDGRMSVSTGPVAPAELAWLRELLTSTDVYEVVGTQLRKIRLTTKDFVDYQDDAGAEGLSFEYSYCFDTVAYDADRLINH